MIRLFFLSFVLCSFAAFAEQPFRISLTQVEEAIAKAVEEGKDGHTIEASITGRRGEWFAETTAPVTFEVKDIKLTAEGHKFEATVVLKDQDKVLETVPVSGKYENLVEVPVLKEAMRPGETIEQDSIEWTKVSENRLRGDVVTKPESLIGMTPERTIAQGKLIRGRDIEPLTLVKKDDTVTMRYRQGSLEVMTLGKAMQEGAIGGTIALRNLDSNRVVRGEVLASGDVLIKPMGALAKAE